ncbi:MAG: hypothetical protein DWQ04_23640, partial [Chloroflexi bacterium]
KNAGNGESGYPKWQEAARYYLKSQGVNESIWNSLPSLSDKDNDIRSRPLFANSLDADILVSVHTNGGGGYGPEAWYDPSNGLPVQSLSLANSIYNNVLSFAKEYNPVWDKYPDRGVRDTESYNNPLGELSLSDMPAAIIEVAFHDTEYPDNAALQDDAFKRGAALSICNGILEYFEEAGTCEKPLLIDQGHNNWYSLASGDEWSYSGFASALSTDGYDIEETTSFPITYEELSSHAAYIIPLAQISPTSQEIQAMQQYVADGGGLLLIADWGGTFSDPSQSLANVFGVNLDANIVYDYDDYVGGQYYWVTYDNGNFSSHTIMSGLNRVQSYASTAMLPGSASPLIVTDYDASPPNRAVAVSLHYGQGRVVILGDSNYHFDENNSYPNTGLNIDDNEQFAINIVDWLVGKSITQAPQANVAFFDDGESGGANWVYDSSWSLVNVDSFNLNQLNNINHAWTDSPIGNYSNNSNVSLTSISIDASTLSNPYLSFLTQYDFEAGNDYGYVEVSKDDGSTWVNVATFTGTNMDWHLEQVGLSNFARTDNLQIRFRLFSNGSIVNDGWYIDNVKIFEVPLNLSQHIYLPMIGNSVGVTNNWTITRIERPNDYFDPLDTGEERK